MLILTGSYNQCYKQDTAVFIRAILPYYLPGISDAPQMKWLHLTVGFVMFVIFTITGQYMRADFPDKDAIPQEFRILMRSRHIYILFAALIHLALGIYIELRRDGWQRVFQVIGSTVLVLSAILLVTAFVMETYTYRQFTDLSRYGIYGSLWGIGFHLIGGIDGRSKS